MRIQRNRGSEACVPGEKTVKYAIYGKFRGGGIRKYGKFPKIYEHKTLKKP